MQINQQFISYNEARDAAVDAGILSVSQYTNWYKTAGIRLPANPNKSYKNQWLGWGSFLGKEIVQFMSYNEARDTAVDAGISTRIQYKKLYKTVNASLPSNPNITYKNQWLGWAAFLEKTQFIPYNEASDAAVDAGILSVIQYTNWYKTAGIRLPANPAMSYKNQWLGWDVFLGKELGELVSYHEARNAAVDAGILSRSQYANWYKTAGIRLPSQPQKVYEDQWLGWNVFLGKNTHYWTAKSLLNTIKSLRPILASLSQAEQYSILNHEGFIPAAMKFSKTKRISNLLNDIVNGTNAFDENSPLEDAIFELTDTDLLVDNFDLENTIDNPNQDQPMSLNDTILTLTQLDTLALKPDNQVIEFILNKRLCERWNVILNASQADAQTELDYLYSLESNNHLVNTYKERFLQEYEGAINLITPDGYQFNKGNGIIEPSLMQKLVVYMQLTKQRFANWSKTGAGKTLGAILASRTINAKLTVIIALNNTLTGWQDEIHNAFPNSNTIIKDEIVLSHNPNYLLLNYETFQQPNAISKINHLLEHNIDMIIIDEVHCAKKRDNIAESKRRKVITTLVETAFTNNPNCNLQVMSATPVVNDLTEAVSLIELLTGNKFNNLDTKPSIHNALEVHKYLTINGIRYKPSYESMHVTTNLIEIQSNHNLATELQSINGNVLELEQILLKEKLDTITNHCKSGTIIYSLFVDKITDQLKNHLINNGFTVGLFTGHDKSGLQPFLDKKIDILIGSSTLSTGVDGLQEVCDNLIIVTLPWTSSQYEQLVGRIYRQGSIFQSINITIPQVILTNNNQEWSWDKQRLCRINSKKTLADSAVDGVIPEGNLMSESELLNHSLTALDNWIKRLESD